MPSRIRTRARGRSARKRTIAPGISGRPSAGPIPKATVPSVPPRSAARSSSDFSQLSLDDAGTGNEGAPRGGERNTARGPRQELGLELAFELGEALAHGGLRYADASRRRPQAAGLAHRDQVPDLIQAHWL